MVYKFYYSLSVCLWFIMCLMEPSHHYFIKKFDESTAATMKRELTDCIYLEDASVQLYGLNIYGNRILCF